MEHATASMDKRWFLNPDDVGFRKWVEEQDRKFQIRMYEVHYPEIMDKYHESKGVPVRVEEEPDVGEPEIEQPKRLLFTKPIEMEKTERQILEEVRHKVAMDYAESMPYGRGKEVIEKVAKKYGITITLLRSEGRNQMLVRARREAVFRLREELGYSFPRIGDLLGGRDHTTALHNYRKFIKAAENEVA